MSGTKGNTSGEGPSTAPMTPAAPMTPGPHAVALGCFKNFDPPVCRLGTGHPALQIAEPGRGWRE